MVVRRRTAALGWGGLLALVLAVSGCTGTGAAAPEARGGNDPLAAVRQAADRLTDSGSSRARTAMRMASGGTEVTIEGEGAFDYARGLGELSVSLPPDPGGDRGAEPVTEVFAPGELFMKNRGAGVPPDKWVRVEVAGVPDGNLVTGGATDPITAFALLRGARSADDLGLTELGGESVRHYRGVTDIALAAEAAPSDPTREQLTAAVAGFTRTEVPFDAYLDEAGTPRRVRHRFSLAQGLRSVEVTSTVTLHGFGVPVDVALPEPGEVYWGAVA
ncbi:hypothetical protein FH609_011000 [Streptomyces sp. 3MP-14]|uniref:LppX_LprAFG lipoprotein n=1 Tax=Streptomyces mimosae TaxID=2586635 RepID=A0A5N5ZTP6_9ACTN|nr:hypothetical protein FH607_029625 [Streptomyces mimosae]KAB8176873.1 hypothetical protein FH609_011000 [Streptomyces sp. 3MP-14]